MRKLWIIAVAGLLCSCAAQRQAQYGATCQAEGAIPGTSEYVECVTAINEARTADIQHQAAALAAVGAALQQAGAASQPIYPPRPLMCQSYQQGYYVNTTCQ